MPAPLETEDQLRLWLKYRLGSSFAFKLWKSADGFFCGEIHDQGRPEQSSRLATGCRSIAECVQRLWTLSTA